MSFYSDSEKEELERKWINKTFDITFYVYKVDNPSSPTTYNTADNWLYFEQAYIDNEEQTDIDTIIQNLGFDGYYMQENGQINLAIFNSNQAKVITNKNYSSSTKKINETN